MSSAETNDQPIHHLYLHFQELPISRRILYTGALLVLGLGYMFALLYVYAAHASLPGSFVPRCGIPHSRAPARHRRFALRRNRKR